jgi:signal peptidase I
LLAVIFRVLNAYVFGIYLVKGNSMYPSLRDGDLCITYKLEPYTHSEVIAYQAGTAVRFARIAAAGNDTVEITQDGILLINGYQPAEEIFYPTIPGPSSESLQITVSEKHWYLLNDFRTDLSDSRTYGSIPESALLGKVIFLFRRRGF